MNKLALVLLAVVAVAALFAFGCKATRSGYESAPYKVVRSEGAYELRDYPRLCVVETSMNGADRNGGFNRLFKFITGSNESNQKIAMTTPVFIQDSATNRSMAFVMPAKMAEGAVPMPSDPAVTVREIPGGRFAVFRFSGSQGANRQDEAVRSLRQWIQQQGLTAEGEAVFGYFDPPWTPAFLRRNEAMLRLAKAGN